MDAVNGTLVPLIGLAIVAFVFIFCRAVTLWYFRLDSIADNLEKIAKHTEYLASQTPPAPAPAPVAPPAPALPPAPRRFPLGGRP